MEFACISLGLDPFLFLLSFIDTVLSFLALKDRIIKSFFGVFMGLISFYILNFGLVFRCFM